MSSTEKKLAFGTMIVVIGGALIVANDKPSKPMAAWNPPPLTASEIVEKEARDAQAR